MKTPLPLERSESTLQAASFKNPPSRLPLLKIALLVFTAWAGDVSAVQQNWAGPGGTTASPTSGIWDTNTPNWGTGLIFTNNNGAVFGGADGTYFIQCVTNLNVTNITFSASGYTLTNDVPRTLGAPNANSSVVVAAGKTGTIGTNVTVSGSGNPFLFNPGAVSAGTLIIDNGGTLQQSANQPLNFDGAPGSTIRVLSGGLLRHGGNGSNIRLGLTANSSPTLSIEGGSFLCNGGASFGSVILSAANSSTSTVTIASGLVSNPFTGNAANGSLNLGNGVPSLSTVNLNGGTLSVATLRKTSTAATTLSVLNFNGGTLQAASGSSGSSFFPANLTNLTANVRNNGSAIDNNGFAITVAFPLTHSSIGGDNATDGGMTFNGGGTTTLTSTNTYNGPTLVNSGSTLSLGTSGSINSSTAVSVSGTLSLSNRVYSNGAGTFTMSDGALSVNSISFPTNVITGTFATAGSANLINFAAIVGAGSPPFAFSVIKYSSLAPGVVDGGNNLTTLAVGSLPPGITGYLTNNAAKKTIDLVVTGGSFAPPVTDPLSTTRYKGYNVQLSVSAIGATGYQWQTNSGATWVNLLDGGNVSGAGGNVLTLTAITLAQAGSYRVLATNSAGSSTSAVATVTVLDTIGYGGTNALLSPIVYYRLNETGDPINTPNLAAADFIGGIDGTYSSNVLNSFYGISGPQPPDFPGLENPNGAAEMTRGYAGSWVVVSNSWPMNTNTASIVAWVRPVDGQSNFAGIVVQRGGAASCGLTYSGATNASGNHTLGYNWNNDGNAFGWDSGLAPAIGQWSMVCLVVTPTNATIYVGATNGLASSVHVLNHAAQNFAGPFYIGADPFDNSRTFNGDVDEVAVFNHALSFNEVLTLLGAAVGTTNFPPVANPLPASIINFEFQSQQISVTAFGSGSLSYQWQKGTNGVYVDVINDSRISGAAAATLSISNLNLADTADYLVIVTNASGSVTSTVSHLTVNPVLGPATNISTSVVSPAGSDWETANTWSIAGNPQTDGATLLSQEYSSGPGQGSTFIIQPAGGLRTPAFNNPNSPTTATFPGDVLVVQGNGTYDPGQTGASGAIRIKGGNPSTVNFKKLVMAGGQLANILNSGWPAIIAGGEVNVLSNSVVWASDDTSPRSINIQSKLTGDGKIIYRAYNTFTTFQTGSSASLNIANANNTYTGTWDVLLGALVGSAANALGTNTITVEAQGALQTTYDLHNLNADLILNGRMYLTQNDTFRSVTVNGSALSAGTYSFAQLSANFPANFPASWTGLNGAASATTGSGSITVLVGQSAPGNVFIGAGGPTGLQLTWTNSSTLLLSATNVLGPWVTNVGASSPYPITNNAPQRFFRLLGQ